MATIKVLDQDTINQIAAGEVVERPSSIVKELVENAIDASSTAITVEIKGGGIDFIRITDNGCGIDKEQIQTAFLPHATSKIDQASDLITVGTLGFRGEALASISAVSQVEMITKTDEGISGIRYVIEGGQERTCQEVGCPEGTTIIVRNLFYNTPARRKFLKSAMTEAGYVEAFLQRLSLSHPDIAFKFINENRMKISTSGNGNLRDVIYHIYGRDVAGNLLPVDREENGIRISGFIGKPVVSRGNRNYENYFVNGRYLKNRIITSGIEDGYKGHAMVHKFPFCVLMISMDPHQVDVNVHPAKMEMRFHNGEILYTVLVNAVRAAFIDRELIPKVRPGRDEREKAEIRRGPEPFERRRAGSGWNPDSTPHADGMKSPEGTGIPKGMTNADAATNGKTMAPPNAAKDSEGMSDSDDPVISRKKMIEERIARLKLRDSDGVRQDIDRQMAGTLMSVREKGEYTTGQGQTSTVQGQEPADQAQDPAGQGQDQAGQRQESAGQGQDQTGQGKWTDGKADRGNDFAFHAEEGKGRQLTFADDTVLSQQARPRHRIIGQIFDTYWLMEYEDKLFFVDQHAAHEKVMYEKLMTQIKNREVLQQQLAPPMVLTLSTREQDRLSRCRDALASIGFTIEDFGEDAIVIRAVPLNLFGMDEKTFFLELFDGGDEFGGKLNSDVITSRVATMACKAAVKGNTRMSIMEMDALMDQLLTLDNPYQCPHGRPTIISMSRYELEKKFKRVQG